MEFWNKLEWQTMLQWSVQVLEGVEIAESVKAQAEQIGVAASKLAKICTALATILWYNICGHNIITIDHHHHHPYAVWYVFLILS